MNPQSPPPDPTADKAPLNQFSQCHHGILTHLLDVGRLPSLLEPARQARQIAGETIRFFRDVVYEHHADEERELFPAVLASAARGEERKKVQEIVDRLTREHRQIEAAWKKMEPELKRVAKGEDAALDGAGVEALVRAYEGHARYEEQVFLPLSETILMRNGHQMANLGLSLHMRHVMPDAFSRLPRRI